MDKKKMDLSTMLNSGFRMEELMERVHTIEDLIAAEQINIIQREEGYVLFISLSLHMAYTDDPLKSVSWKYRLLSRIGLYQPDERYRNFLYSVMHYINFHRGLQDEKPYWAPLYILVSKMDGKGILLNGYFDPTEGGLLRFQSSKD